jgi:hypothetical protein
MGTHHGVCGNARNEPANGGREARGGAARQLETNEVTSLGRNQDGHHSHTSTAGLTAPVRLNADKFIDDDLFTSPLAADRCEIVSVLVVR